MIIDWFKISYFMKPLSEVAEETGFVKGLTNLIVVTLIWGVISLIFGAFLTIAPFGASQSQALIGLLGMAVIYLIVVPIIVFIITLIYSGIVFVLAKLLGGTGSFSKTFGVLARISAATTVAYFFPLSILTVLLVLGLSIFGTQAMAYAGIVLLLLLLIEIALLLLVLYLEAKTISIVHSFGIIKGFVATALIPILLIILVVVGLVVVGLSLQLMTPGNNVPQSTAMSAWKSAEPIAIVDYMRTGNELTLLIKNNSFESLTVTSIKAEQVAQVTSGELAPGASTKVTISGFSNCSSGAKYAIPKQSIQIFYDTTSIPGKVQSAVADIVGTCE